MKRGSTLFLRAAVLAIGTGILALCIFALPAIWRAVPDEYPHMTNVFYMILLAMYAAAVPFFIGLYQALRILSLIDKNTAFSLHSVRALKVISYCAVSISIIYAAILPLLYTWAQNDDAPGLIVIGMIFVGASLTVAVFSMVLERLFRDAITIKSENDLTV